MGHGLLPSCLIVALLRACATYEHEAEVAPRVRRVRVDDAAVQHDRRLDLAAVVVDGQRGADVDVVLEAAVQHERELAPPPLGLGLRSATVATSRRRPAPNLSNVVAVPGRRPFTPNGSQRRDLPVARIITEPSRATRSAPASSGSAGGAPHARLRRAATPSPSQSSASPSSSELWVPWPPSSPHAPGSSPHAPGSRDGASAASSEASSSSRSTPQVGGGSSRGAWDLSCAVDSLVQQSRKSSDSRKLGARAGAASAIVLPRRSVPDRR